MIKKMDISTFLRNFNILPNGSVDFFLGSGASAQAGIPTGKGLVWNFKREIYCTETQTSKEQFKDLFSQESQKILQNYFNAQRKHPSINDPKEYSYYFELCYPTKIAREQFIQTKVRDVAPSLGHLCLADLFIAKKIQRIWTTNFDELIESGIKTISPEYSFNVFSSANSKALEENKLNTFSSVYKLHGDYRYDNIKNTSEELQKLEATMHTQFEKSLYGKGLVFLGYSGYDESIMQILEENIDKPGFLQYGLIWLIPDEVNVSNRTSILMERACKLNELSCIVEIPSFDEFMYDCYKNCSKINAMIEDRWRDFPKRKIPIDFSGNNSNVFIKTNTFISTKYPLCRVFKTNITSWKELKEITQGKEIIAGLFKNQIFCFENEEKIREIFHIHIQSEILEEKISNKMLYQPDSVYNGMLYNLIEKALIKDFNLLPFGKNKFYDPVKHSNYEHNFIAYDGIEISLSFYEGKCYLSIVITVYLHQKNGETANVFLKQRNVNQIMSTIYNNQYSEKLKYWNEKLKRGLNVISFIYKEFALEFNYLYMSSGGENRNSDWPSLSANQYDEPEMLFNACDKSQVAVNQLRGISKYGPIDCSYIKKNTNRSNIKIAVITSNQQKRKILTHLSTLNQHSSQRADDGFLQPYNGFEIIYKRGIQIPTEQEDSCLITYDEESALKLNTNEFLNLMKDLINKLVVQPNIDVAVIYFPDSFKKYREINSPENDFNLHDALKLYATDRDIKLQIIEEKSVNSPNPCKVLWGLSTSLYAKASGVLWQPRNFTESTAFVGVSYAQSKSKGTCIGCSQLFDSTGTGLKLLLRKIDDPAFHGKNPFMKKDDARKMMSSLRDQYYKCDPTARLNRIVIHKTTFFTNEEIRGFTQALEGIDDIELLQIQEYCPWRAIRFGIKYQDGPHKFAIKRGTTIKLNSDTFLLWTHGCVIHPELKGTLNYYKGGRGIPTPLLIKRFYGKASGDTLVKEILMLSKMNWNSGDNLYKKLPVTLDFAKVLSRMSKQDEAIYNKAYDFRYFM